MSCFTEGGPAYEGALALMAKKLGKQNDFQFLMKRAGYYRNVYDSVSGFMRGKNKFGKFKQNIEPTEVVGEWLPQSDFTEGNAYHYQFHVLHDIPRIIQLHGGKDIFARRLDSIFFNKSNPLFAAEECMVEQTGIRIIKLIPMEEDTGNGCLCYC